MKQRKVLAIVTVVLGLTVMLALGGCPQGGDTDKLKVVTSTSLISAIVERVGSDMVDVVNIIPSAQCPGHFDVKPGDIQKLADADLFLLHSWQGEKFSQELIDSANNPDLTVVQINVKVGENTNWMAPPVQIEAINQITASLCQMDNANSPVYQQLTTDFIDIVTAKGAEITARLADINPSGINVMCAEMQTGFIQWTGLNLVTNYGRPDSLTPQVVRDLVDTGRQENVILIIDNLQSGQDAGKGVAEELGCERIILSNFPGGVDNTDTWEEAIEYNIELILGVIAQQAQG